MNRRMIVLTCFLWGIGCVVLFCVYVIPLQSTDVGISTEPEISFVPCELSPVNLPTPLKGTDLVLKELFAYDGAYLEDELGQEVIGVTAVLIENVGDFGIERARVVVCQGGRLLKFTIDSIPPGAQAFALEQDRTLFCQDVVKYCYGTQRLRLDGWDMS